MNGGRLLHLTDGALRLALRIHMWHLSHLYTQPCSPITVYFLSFCVSPCSGSVALVCSQFQKHDGFCWSLSPCCFGSSTTSLCYHYLLKYELVTLQYRSKGNGPGNSESGSSRCCARTGSFETLSGICLSAVLGVRPGYTVKSRSRLQIVKNIYNMERWRHLTFVPCKMFWARRF